MKIIIGLLFTFIFFSCNSVETETKINDNIDTSTIEQKKSNVTETDTSISIEGFWIDEKYYNELVKTKSPKEIEIPTISCFQIPKSTKQITRFVYGFYESGADLIVVKNGSEYEFFNSETKTKNQITIVSNEIIKVDNQTFTKLRNLDLINDPNGVKILENLLFSGKYRNSNDQIVEFKGNGELKGLENYNQYDVPIEMYSEGVNNNSFLISKNGKNEVELGFKFKGDSLFIYNLKCLEFDGKNNICYKSEFESLKTSLVKVQ